jgi:hypothetical protein
MGKIIPRNPQVDLILVRDSKWRVESFFYFLDSSQFFLKKGLLPLQRLHFLRKPAPEVLPDPATILPEVFVHRGVKRGEPGFSPYL